ncbi:energy-coupling factor ABC transporter permease, partial [Ferrovibrio sp.]|uniref:energy-coupling factor ABC transporter permease n=2 Tax=Ferrovibrio sp. TaxID=1917215 RepID=UPI0035AF8FB3
AMHIEPGIIDAARLTGANLAAAGLLATQARGLIRAPHHIVQQVVKTLLAASVFSVLMQVWHLPVGPSELHLIGATTVYLLFGFTPTLLGFGLGLLLQALLFEPQDLLHLGVNTLSLGLPLVAMHASFGRRLFAVNAAERFTLLRVLRLDAVYYAGVVAMVGFWLLLSSDAFAVADWARWALAYMPVVLLEAMLSFIAVTVIGRWRRHAPVQLYTELGRLHLA